jgi:glycosyltransferase involved in cell wall biosynthesis
MFKAKDPVFVHLNFSGSYVARMDLLRRLDFYGGQLAAKVEQRLLVVLGVSVSDDIRLVSDNFKNVDIAFVDRSRINPLTGYLNLKRLFLEHNIHPKVLIASEFWIDLIPLLMLRLMFKSRIQISIHGFFKSFSFFYLFLKIFARQVDSVRTVNESLSLEIAKEFRVDSSKIFIAPIPVDVPTTNYHRQIKYDLAFVGRLHKERNVEELVDIAIEVAAKVEKLDIVIAGEGGLKRQIEERFAELGSQITCDFVGYVPNSKVFEIYRSSRILLTAAKSESYGMAIREAVLSGTTVVAKESVGSISASKLFRGSVFLYSDVPTSVKTIIDLLNAPLGYFSKDLSQIHKIQELENTNSVNGLISSWLTG